MMQILTNDVVLRFVGGFAIGCVIVLSGAYDLFNAVA